MKVLYPSEISEKFNEWKKNIIKSNSDELSNIEYKIGKEDSPKFQSLPIEEQIDIVKEYLKLLSKMNNDCIEEIDAYLEYDFQKGIIGRLGKKYDMKKKKKNMTKTLEKIDAAYSAISNIRKKLYHSTSDESKEPEEKIEEILIGLTNMLEKTSIYSKEPLYIQVLNIKKTFQKIKESKNNEERIELKSLIKAIEEFVEIEYSIHTHMALKQFVSDINQKLFNAKTTKADNEYTEINIDPEKINKLDNYQYISNKKKAEINLNMNEYLELLKRKQILELTQKGLVKINELIPKTKNKEKYSTMSKQIDKVMITITNMLLKINSKISELEKKKERIDLEYEIEVKLIDELSDYLYKIEIKGEKENERYHYLMSVVKGEDYKRARDKYLERYRKEEEKRKKELAESHLKNTTSEYKSTTDLEKEYIYLFGNKNLDELRAFINYKAYQEYPGTPDLTRVETRVGSDYYDANADKRNKFINKTYRKALIDAIERKEKEKNEVSNNEELFEGMTYNPIRQESLKKIVPKISHEYPVDKDYISSLYLYLPKINISKLTKEEIQIIISDISEEQQKEILTSYTTDLTKEIEKQYSDLSEEAQKEILKEVINDFETVFLIYYVIEKYQKIEELSNTPNLGKSRK